MNDKKVRSEARKRADANYERKRALSLTCVSARFNDAELEIIREAIKKAGSNKEMMLKGAKLILNKK